MDWTSFASAAVSGGSSLIGGALGLLGTHMNNVNNQMLMQEQNKENRNLTEQSWARDDNAVQRRIADLKAAGLSPVLAAGSAAGNTNPIQAHSATSSPLDFSFLGDAGSRAIESLFKAQEVSNSTDMIRAQIGRMQDSTLIDLQKLENEMDMNTFKKNQTYKDNEYRSVRLELDKNIARAANEVAKAQYLLAEKKYNNELFNNNLYWTSGLPAGASDLLTKFGLQRFLSAVNLITQKGHTPFNSNQSNFEFKTKF